MRSEEDSAPPARNLHNHSEECRLGPRRHFLKMALGAFALSQLANTRPLSRSGLEDDCKQCCPLSDDTVLPKAVKLFQAGVPQTGCIVDDQMKAGLFFTSSAVFDDTQAGYTKYEYRQNVKGYISYWEPGAKSWVNVYANLRGNVTLSPYDYQEDGFASGAAYGHRDPATKGCSDSYGPGMDREHGWLYTMSDHPGIQNAQEGTQYQIKLDFCLDIVDSTTMPLAVFRRRRLPVRCCGKLPQTQGCILPEDPPAPYFPPKPQDSFEHLAMPKAFGDYFSRVIIEQRPSTNLAPAMTLVYVCIIKSNQAPRINSADLKLRLFDGSGRDLNAPSLTPDGNAPVEGLLVEANSASTTAQKLFIYQPVAVISKAIVTLGRISVPFSGPEIEFR